jgi:alkylation response protein AidB-like acyl-CoA dehydrogenase
MTDGIIPQTAELRELRSAARSIAEKYGHRYFVECARTHKEPTELYEQLGAAGFLGVHLPADRC